MGHIAHLRISSFPQSYDNTITLSKRVNIISLLRFVWSFSVCKKTLVPFTHRCIVPSWVNVEINPFGLREEHFKNVVNAFRYFTIIFPYKLEKGHGLSFKKNLNP